MRSASLLASWPLRALLSLGLGASVASLAPSCAEPGAGDPSLAESDATDVDVAQAARDAWLTRLHPAQRSALAVDRAPTWSAAGQSLHADFGQAPGVLSEVALRGDGETRLVQRMSGVGVRFSLEGARSEAEAVLEDGLVLHHDALPGALRIHRAEPEGVEELVLLTAPRAKSELRWSFTTESVRALRLAHGVLELLDHAGVPRLRVARPWVIDADGVRHEAELEVDGCAVDRDPAPAWGRELVELDELSCELVVRWAEGLAHPLLVDPTWVSAGTLNVPRSNHSSTVLTAPQQEILIAGGFDASGAAIADAEVYCPAETCGAPGAFTLVGSLGAARGGHTATLVAPDQVLIVGGRAARGGAVRTSSELYSNTSKTFAPSGALGRSRVDHTATLLSGAPTRVLVAGGDSGTVSTGEIWQGGSFGTPINMTAPRVGHSAELLAGSGRVLVAGGIGTLGSAVQTAEIYDPGTNAFAAVGSMTSPRAYATATRLDDARVLVAGGTNGVGFYYKTADVFVPSPTGGAFQQQVILMQTERAHHAAVALLGTGRVLLTGGYNASGGGAVLTSAEAFDVGLNQFVLPADMLEPRSFHTASLLATGRALVVGGGYDLSSGQLDIGSALTAEILQRDDGEVCETDQECASGFCVGLGTKKICCNTACTGACESCFLEENETIDGTCSPVDGQQIDALCVNAVKVVLACTAGQVTAPEVEPCEPYQCAGIECATSCTDDAGCTSSNYCRNGNCLPKLPPSNECARDGECQSGFCTDGVCCNARCDETCLACDIQTETADLRGVCSQLRGAPPRPSRTERCIGEGTECAGSCETQPDACDYGTDVRCGESSCTGSELSFGRCDFDLAAGTSSCESAQESCEAYVCDEAGVACRTSCEGVADCEGGRVCSDGECVLVQSTVCGDTQTLVSPDGARTDCAPFRCVGTACLNRCNSVDDCVTGKVCDDAGACVDPPPDPPPPSGCSTSGGSSSGGLGTLALAALGLWSARRRRELRGAR